MYKFVALLLAFIAAASAMPQYGGHGYHEPEYPSQPIKYQFKYDVHDPHTHDIKSQEESSDGHYVKGVYKLVEPYGGERVVQYADDGHGFVAHVHTSKIQHPQTYSHGYEKPAYH